MINWGSQASIRDPVVLVAMRDVTAWVFSPHQRQLGNRRKPAQGMINSSSRAAVVHAFMRLTHNGRSLDPAELRAWALGNGWPPDDADLMRDYAQGVVAGLRHHTDPDPFGPLAYERWVAEANVASDEERR
jgi:hypothetical protein